MAGVEVPVVTEVGLILLEAFAVLVGELIIVSVVLIEEVKIP